MCVISETLSEILNSFFRPVFHPEFRRIGDITVGKHQQLERIWRIKSTWLGPSFGERKTDRYGPTPTISQEFYSEARDGPFKITSDASQTHTKDGVTRSQDSIRMHDPPIIYNILFMTGDYSKPSHEGYRNTIELPVGNNVVPLRSDTIRLVQNRCSFDGLRSEDPNQHLKDFLKLVDSLDLDGENRERTRLSLFQFSLRDQACNWLERLPAGAITTWEDLTTRFLAQFFPPGRTAKLRNDILMFQQHHGDSLSEAWTHFKDLLQKVPRHGIDLWLHVTPHQGGNARRDEKGNHHNTLVSNRETKTCIKYKV
ncbi:zinc finger, CCHC-type containing protein [Tanacetum coccineum]